MSFLLRSYHPQVGHAGTLDPMATGLLIVCVGKATKVVDRLATTSFMKVHFQRKFEIWMCNM